MIFTPCPEEGGFPASESYDPHFINGRPPQWISILKDPLPRTRDPEIMFANYRKYSPAVFPQTFLLRRFFKKALRNQKAFGVIKS